MTSYPPTLLPSSPPYDAINTIILILCDRCLIITGDPSISEDEKQQLFDVTMSLVDFWEAEEATNAL